MLSVSLCELFGTFFCAVFGISVPTSTRTDHKAFAASTNSFVYSLQSVDLENSQHLRSTLASETKVSAGHLDERLRQISSKALCQIISKMTLRL
jgi:hypothetical protein